MPVHSARGSQRKGSFPKKGKRVGRTPKFGGKRKKINENEEISSEDEDFSADEGVPIVDESEDDFEDVQKTAFRKAKQLLSDVRAEEEREEGEGLDEAAVAHRLKEDALSRIATRHRPVALSAALGDSVVQYRPHRFSVVGLAISHDCRYVVSCSKDATIVKYDLEEGKKMATLKYDKKSTTCHKGQVFVVAISPEDRFLVSGGADCVIRVWNFATMEHIKDLSGHKNAITGLAFRIGTQQLFSSSRDRTVKAWDLEQMGYVDTMFGHADSVSGIDVLSRERVVTCGSQDRTLRMWKVAEESQLVFNGFGSSLSIDCIAMINEDHFVSGSADGSLCVWSIFKKKPVCVHPLAHGRSSDGQPNWVVSVAVRRYTDLLASGSCDSFLRFWKIADDYKTLSNVFSCKLVGFINCLRFSEDGDEIACAVGQEHKDGRWWKVTEAKNVVAVIPLNYSQKEQP